MSEPLRQAVERMTAWADREEKAAAHVQGTAFTGTEWGTDIIAHHRQLCADLRTILAALAHPLLGGDLGSDPEDLSRSASGEREEARVGHWRCTRCGQNEITARANGCTRGPCPMEPI